MAKFEKNRGNDNGISMSGIANVIIPEGADSAEYVQRCYRNNTVSIGGGYGCTAMHHVRATHGVLNQIKFPSADKPGSAVLWIRESFSNKPVVIGVFRENGLGNLTTDGQERLYQEYGQQIVEMFLDALNGRINISASGDGNKPGEVLITANSRTAEGNLIKLVSKDKIRGEAKTLELQLTKNFDISIHDGEKEILKLECDDKKFRFFDQWQREFLIDEEKLSYKDAWEHELIINEDELHYKDSKGNEYICNEDNTQILCPKFNVGDGNEPMVLGQTLVDLLGEILDAITAITVPTAHGPSSTPLNSSQFSAIKGKLNNILSQLSNTD